MTGINEKSWKVLTSEEQTAITLTIIQNLSTLKAGEIMGKSHYKYLEILERSKAYLKIFQHYLEVHNDIIPNYINVTPNFREYLNLTILKRLTVKESCSEISNPNWMYREFREKEIIREMVNLTNSPHLFNRDFALLVKDFDRWNNYRILPYEVQDLSAFKRRNKNILIKALEQILNLHPYSINKIIDRYKYKGNSKLAKVGYCVMFKRTRVDNEIKIVKLIFKIPTGVDTNPDKSYRELGLIGIHVFKTKIDALKYINLVNDYLARNRSCTLGQKFWPPYRTLINESLNIDYIMKVIPTRKHLDHQLVSLDIKFT